MRKKLALLLAGVMVAAVVPFSTAMAGTQNYADSTPTVQKGYELDNLVGGKKAPNLVVKDNNKDIDAALVASEDVEFTLELDGAEWLATMTGDVLGDGSIDVTPVDETTVTVTVLKGFTSDGIDVYRIPLLTKIKNKGDITVTVDGKGGKVSSGTYTFAVCISGSAAAKIKDKVSIPEDGATIKNITISESAPGALDAGTIKFKLSKGFKFNIPSDPTTPVITDSTGYMQALSTYTDNELEIKVVESVDKAMEYIFKGIEVIPTKKAKPGDVAEITISGAGITKTTLEVGTYVDYGVKVSLFDEEKDVPVFAAGKVYTEEDKATLSVLISETVANSMNTGRKITFKFPEGIKVVDCYADGLALNGEDTGVYEESDSDAWANVNSYNFDVDGEEVTISKIVTADPAKKTKMAFKFNLAISPEFTGDVDVKVGGAAIGVEETLTVATVKAPFTVEAKVNEVAIDYRNVAVSDIVIKEAEPGIFKDDESLLLAVENMQFEKGYDHEITGGDIDIEKPDVRGGSILLRFKEESAKTAGEITLSNLQLYLNRSLPAGDYDLIIKTRDGIAFSRLFASCSYAVPSVANDGKPYFDIDELTLVKGYVKVVTAGRDVDDSTFTTKIVVPVGEKTIKAGEKEIAIDVPAFINADGYTMMPLRAVVEALSGTAIVAWDGDTKTATVLFGARVISMTIGQKSMKINGVDVAMLAAPVIVESRTFLPLRDLGYALGLNESQVNWDSATKTATLN